MPVQESQKEQKVSILYIEMKKKVGIIKRNIAIFLIIAMSINNFAAVVSDNDGSAFITKAEFDALKSNFQSQIDSYNNSIDSKIDGAIASYLAGISLSTEIKPRVLLPNYITINGTSNNILYWSGKVNYVLNSEQNHWPKRVGLWNVCYYNADLQTEVSTRQDGMHEQQLVARMRDANKYVPVIWFDDANRVTQVANTQVLLTFSAQLYYTNISNGWGMPDSTFGMVTGWNTGQTFGKPLFAGNGHGPLASASDATHYYNKYWYSYVYMYNSVVETDASNPNIAFNVAPLATTNDWMKKSTNNNFDFYWKQENVNTTTRLKAPSYGSKDDLDHDFWETDVYADWKVNEWTKGGSINGVWDPVLRLWTAARPCDLIWPFFTSVDSENQEIKKGIKLCEIDKKGSLTIEIKCDKNGYVIIYNAATPDIYWTDRTLGKTRTSETDTSWKSKPNCYQVTANTMKNITLPSVEQNDKLWILYLPGGFTGSGGSWVGVDDGVIDSCNVTLTVEN